jgi:predicted metal-binding protein
MKGVKAMNAERKGMGVKFEVLQEDLDALLDYSKELGAREAIPINKKDIFYREWVRHKCGFPNCGAYAVCFQCPPSTPRKEETEAAVVPSYEWGVLAVIYSSPEEVGMQSDGDMVRAYDRESRWSARINNLVGKIESRALELGYYKAMGFTCGPCTLCGMWTGKWITDELARVFSDSFEGEQVTCGPMRGGMCTMHRQARPSGEPCGIDIIEFIREAGLATDMLIMPEIAPDCVPECPYYGLVLVG